MTEIEMTMEPVNIGADLRQAREARGVSVEDVSAVLKIRVGDLKSLENDDFEELPAAVYAIGFIRSYATYLDLNAGELINRYKAAMAAQTQEDAPYDPQAESEQMPVAVKLAIGAVVIFAVYILWLLAGGASGPEAVSKSVTKAVETPARATTSQPSKTPVATRKPSVKVATKPKIARTEAAKTAAAKTGKEPAKRALDPLRTPVAVEVEPIAALDAAVTPSKIEIRAVRRTWLRIENTEGQVLLSSIVTDGDSFELSLETPYTLATRDAGALKYVVNGQIVGSVGRRSQILTARQIDRSSILTLKP
jgi:cytoskeleton protein RodZ